MKAREKETKLLRDWSKTERKDLLKALSSPQFQSPDGMNVDLVKLKESNPLYKDYTDSKLCEFIKRVNGETLGDVPMNERKKLVATAEKYTSGDGKVDWTKVKEAKPAFKNYNSTQLGKVVKSVKYHAAAP